MPKRQLSGREILQDIRSGINDAALMGKYKLSAQGLQSVFTKLIAIGALKQAELDKRTPAHEQTVNLLWKCPACGKPQEREFEECPECGIIVAKFIDTSTHNASLAQDQIGGTPSFFNAHRREMILVLGGLLLLGIVGAGLWIKSETDRKRQVEGARTERIEREQRLKTEAEAKAREAREQQLLEKVSSIEEMEAMKKFEKDLHDKMRSIDIFFDTVRRFQRPGVSIDQAEEMAKSYYRENGLLLPKAME